MRIYYAGDVHGSERCWRKFLAAAAFYDADALILGGDITGKALAPIVDGSEEDEQRARFNGFYPYRCTRDEYERLAADEDHRERVLSELMLRELERWLALAEERLDGVPCLVMPGNDDELAVDEVLARSEAIVNPDGRVVRLGEYQVLSSAWASPTPWDSPRELPEDELEAKLEELAAQLDPDVPAIFNLHCPPYDSGLDRAPQLSDDLRVVTRGGQQVLEPVGSRAVRAVIERHQPLLGLHGHIHESRHAAKLGRTLCLNPGSAYAEGVLDGVLVDLDGDRVVRHQFVQG